MNISDRYRDLFADVNALPARLGEGGDEEEKALRQVQKAAEKLAELKDQVGDIPRIRLESQLTPVLLKAHGALDRARLLLEEEGEEDGAAAVWELEQKIYRLLNDL